MQKSTAGYIINNNKLLLLLRDNTPTIPDPNTWDTPGGEAEDNESHKDCLIRELEEELELKLKKDRLKFLWEGETPKGNTEHSFLIEITDSEKRDLVLHEGQKMNFFPFWELDNLEVTKHLTSIRKTNWNKLKKLLS